MKIDTTMTIVAVGYAVNTPLQLGNKLIVAFTEFEHDFPVDVF